jgi:macrolide phosphotransferase
MARTLFTLAAAVSAVAPDADIVAVAPLTENSTGRVDAVQATLDTGAQVVIRVATDPEAGDDLRADARALRALTPGVRALLPYSAPELLGEVPLADDTAVITSFIAGYRVDPGEVPAGPGVAPALAEALAATHALPVSWAREAGLVVRSAEQVRDEASRLVDRAEHTKRMPRALVSRWRRAIADDDLWRFEPTVVLGGASSSSFFLDDHGGVPTVVGVVDWHAVAVGDPAVDLQWLASAPAAAGDVLNAYVAASSRAPDGLLRSRARLHAELEFAAWLVHGHDADDRSIVADAEALLSSLADTVGADDLVVRTSSGMDDAMAVLGSVPDTSAALADADAQPADTSMHTDAYDPEELAMWLPAQDDGQLDESSDTPDAEDDSPAADDEAVPALESEGESAAASELVTAPIILPASSSPALFTSEDGSDADEPARAARAAFQRWASSGSE